MQPKMQPRTFLRKYNDGHELSMFSVESAFGQGIIAIFDGKIINAEAYYSMEDKVPDAVKLALKTKEALNIKEITDYVKEKLPLLAETKEEKRISVMFGPIEIMNVLKDYKQKGIVKESVKTETDGKTAHCQKMFKLKET